MQIAYRLDVLDHGYVTLRNVSGPTRRLFPHNSDHGEDFAEFDASDVDPAQAARKSFDQMDSDRTLEQDMKLADYLMKNKHTTPFEMVETWWEMKLPIFCARQFVRHRTVSIDEVSGRYVVLPEEWYIPDVVGGKAKSAKQGQEDNLPLSVQLDFRGALDGHCRNAYKQYLMAIDNGVAPEHARMFLSLNHYTMWLWKQDLHNLMHFLSLRAHSHAQVEAQKYAEAMISILRSVLPETMKLFDKYRRLT